MWTAEGLDPLLVESAAQAVEQGRDPTPILMQARHALKAREEHDRLRRDPPPLKGAARWTAADELRAADLLHSYHMRAEDPEAIYLGGFKREDTELGAPPNTALHWRGESHLVTVAQTRAGKSVNLIVPNLLRYKGAAVVLDPKGELFAMTARWRAERVGPVYVLNPFELAAVGTQTDAFNPLDMVENDYDARVLAEMIAPPTQDPRQDFFDKEVINFLSGLIEFIARFAPPEQRTMRTLRQAIVGHELEVTARAMADPHMPESIRNAGELVAEKFDAPERFQVSLNRLRDSLEKELRLWDSEALRRATARSDFDFKDLKDGPITVYLALPIGKLQAYSTFVKVVFAAALDAMEKNPRVPDIPVLFLLDEFLRLEPSDRFAHALHTHAGMGVRLWFILQDLPTLKKLYKETYDAFLEVEVLTFFGISGLETAKFISERLGTQTKAVHVSQISGGSSAGSTSYSLNDSVSFEARPLLTPQEVIGLLGSSDASLARHAIHFIRGFEHGIHGVLTPWHLDEAVRTRCDATWQPSGSARGST